MLVPSDVHDGVVLHERAAQGDQPGVLGWLKRLPLKPFEFNANAVVIAVAAATVVRLPGMPGPIVATDKLP